MRRRARAAALAAGALLFGAACATGATAPPPPPVAPRAAEADRLPPPPLEPARPSVDEARILAEITELQNAVARLIAQSRRQDDHLAGLERRLAEIAERRNEAPQVPPGFAPSGIGAAAPSSAPAPGTSVSAADLYASGMARFRSRDYDTAILVLSELVSSYPTHPLRESAQMTVAEMYSMQKDYQGALAELERLVEAVPRGAKTPEAWVKIGVARRELGDEAGARKAWERVLSEHDRTDSARQARELLRTSPKS